MAASAGADMIGMVGPMPSGAGVIDLATARVIAEGAAPWITPVLLTSGETAEAIAEGVDACPVRCVQIVRHVAPEVHRALAHRLPGVRRIQAIHVEGPEALELIPVTTVSPMRSCSIRAGRARKSSAARGGCTTGGSAPSSCAGRACPCSSPGACGPTTSPRRSERSGPSASTSARGCGRRTGWTGQSSTPSWRRWRRQQRRGADDPDDRLGQHRPRLPRRHTAGAGRDGGRPRLCAGARRQGGEPVAGGAARRRRGAPCRRRRSRWRLVPRPAGGGGDRRGRPRDGRRRRRAMRSSWSTGAARTSSWCMAGPTGR